MWLLQTSRGSKRSAEALDRLLREDRGTSDDAKRPKCMDAHMLSHEEKLERRCAVPSVPLTPILTSLCAEQTCDSSLLI